MALVVERTLPLIGADGAAIELAEGDERVYRAGAGIAAGQLGLRLRLAGSLSGQCVQRGEILYCTDSEDDPRVDREACRGVGLRSMIVVPLRHEGETVDMPEGGRAIVQRIKNEIAPPLHFEGQTFPLSASIGVAAFPDDGHDIDTLLHAADQRMYRVKGARQASRPACVDAPGEASAAVWQRRADA